MEHMQARFKKRNLQDLKKDLQSLSGHPFKFKKDKIDHINHYDIDLYEQLLLMERKINEKIKKGYKLENCDEVNKPIQYDKEFQFMKEKTLYADYLVSQIVYSVSVHEA